MAVVPPRGHVNPIRRPDVDLVRPDLPGRKIFNPGSSVDSQTPPARPPADADIDATLPAPTVTVHPTPTPVEIKPAVQQPLENYWIKSAVQLPTADGDGFRVYNKRQYVDVLDGGTVLVGVDPDTGLYRARLSNELRPSGPVLLRDLDSGLWYPREETSARTIALTEESLHGFRTGLDLSGVEPGSDGLFRHDGKLYVVIHERAYQVMEDPDASNPEAKVWRIVNPKDPVATDIANVYRASRSGETRAITRNQQNTWVYVPTGLRGGMDRNAPGQVNTSNFHRPWLTDSAGPSVVQPPVVATTTRAQVQSYFPEATDLHADDFIARFASKEEAEIELKRLKLGFAQLDREVTAWEVAYKGTDSVERNRRTALGEKFRRLYKWQGEPSERVYRDGQLIGFKLDINLGSRGNLKQPVFAIRLNSVVSLSLEGDGVHTPGNLLSMFSHIESLQMRELRGTGKELLVAINKLAQLRVLEIQGMRLLKQESDAVHFGGLTRLRELSLVNCVVGYTLSVRGMTELRVLRLSSLDLMNWPEGLNDSSLSRLQVLDLSSNQGLRGVLDLSHMSDLRELDLSNTLIRELPVGIADGTGPAQLEILRLPYTSIPYEPSLEGMTGLRELDLRSAGLMQLPAGLGTAGGPSGLEILKLGNNRGLNVAPSFKLMTALREVDLSRTGIDRFPEGITREIPKTSLNLADNNISLIPEFLELRKGFDLTDNPIVDSASMRRLIAARRETGTDVWLGRSDPDDRSASPWLQDVPQVQMHENLELWNILNEGDNAFIKSAIHTLSKTPEFRVERQQLQHRVWAFLKSYKKADPVERLQLRRVVLQEKTSPGQMLERLEEEIKKFDPTWQNQPPHHLPKRPRFE